MPVVLQVSHNNKIIDALDFGTNDINKFHQKVPNCSTFTYSVLMCFSTRPFQNTKEMG